MNDSSTPTPGRALASSSGSRPSGWPAAGFQRTATALRTVLPHLLRLLPLLDGNIGSAVSNLLNQQPPQPPPLPPVDLEPIEKGLAELRAEHRGLRSQVAEVLDQNESLKRVEGKLKVLEDAATRNIVEQQELLKALKAVSNRVEELTASGRRLRVFALVALALFGLAILLNLVLLLRALHILP
jgi:hypothetical protein